MRWSDHLQKAKRALQHAADMEVEIGADRLPNGYADLLRIADVQAQMSQAESLERIAYALEMRNARDV